MKTGRYISDYATQPGLGGTLGELFKHRHLLFHLVKSDVRNRYRRTYLGIAWALVWPIAFSFIIASVAIYIFKSALADYLIYIISGFMVWELISGAIVGGASCLIQSEGYVRQARIPYLLFAIRMVLSLSVNYFFSAIAAVGLVAVLRPDWLGPALLLLPVVWLMTALLAVPLALISGIANMRFRDYQHGISLVIFLLWYLSPNMVARDVYESAKLKIFTDINPAASLLDLSRLTLMQPSYATLQDVAVWAVYTVIAWTIGLLWLKRESSRLIYFM
jgi:lipopolysaccharide transport system permease protein